MISQLKNQLMGATWTILATIGAGAIIWSVTTVEDKNHWDSEAVAISQIADTRIDMIEQYVEANQKALVNLNQMRLRTEQRNISKELKRLYDAQEPLTETEQHYLEMLEEQLEEVQREQDKEILLDMN